MMDKETLKLIKRDMNANGTSEIITYENTGEGMRYVTCKNGKPSAWSSDLNGGLLNHDLFVKPKISGFAYDDRIKGYGKGDGDKKKSNNSSLHDFQPGFEIKLDISKLIVKTGSILSTEYIAL